MSGKHGGCSGCGGCASKVKPADCESNGCGRCCGNSCKKGQGESFILLLRERQFLPFIYVDEQIIFKTHDGTTEEEQDEFFVAIKECEQLKYLTIDFDDPLDELSYIDYANEKIKIENRGGVVGMGTIAITQLCIDSFR